MIKTKKRMWCQLCREELTSDIIRPNRRWCEKCRNICKRCKVPLKYPDRNNNTLCRPCMNAGHKIKDLFPRFNK